MSILADFLESRPSLISSSDEKIFETTLNVIIQGGFEISLGFMA